TGALLSLIEVPVAILHERLRISRRRATALTLALLALPSAGAALSQSVLANARIAGLNLFELFDFLSSNIVLPVGGIFIALFVGWVWGRNNFRAALSNDGLLANQYLADGIFVLLRYISPILILLIMGK